MFYDVEGGSLTLNGVEVNNDSNYDGTLFLLDSADGLVDGSNTLSINLTADYYYNDARVEMLTSVTIAAGVTVQGSGSVTDNYGGQGQEIVVNQGLIEANVNGSWLYVDPTGFVNEATAEALDGGILSIGGNNGYTSGGTQWINAAGGVITATDSTLYLTDRWTNDGSITATGSTVELGGSYDYSDNGYWVNDGTISVTGGTLQLGAQNLSTDTLPSYVNDGTITATGANIQLYGAETLADMGDISRTGGTIELYGSLDAGGATIDTTQGLFQNLALNGGTLASATVLQGAGGELGFANNNNNVLSNDTVEGGLTVASGFVQLTNGTKIEDASGANPGAITLTSSGLVIEGQTSLVNNVTLASSNLYFTSPVDELSSLNTDEGNLAGGSADPNWTVNGAGAAVFSDGAVNGSSVNNLYGAWQADNSVSGWIGVNNSTSEPLAPYSFTTTFNVADAADLVLAGLFFVDDTGNVTLNGAQVASASDVCNGTLFVLDFG